MEEQILIGNCLTPQMVRYRSRYQVSSVPISASPPSPNSGQGPSDLLIVRFREGAAAG